MRTRVMPDELREGDVLPDPHFSGRPGVVLEVIPTWYGASVRYEYDGGVCCSAVFKYDVQSPPAASFIKAGIVVERPGEVYRDDYNRTGEVRA